MVTVKAWGGRRVAVLTAGVLRRKGKRCHLCGLPGADSPDHDPPRSVLIRQGVPDPDAMRYLFPAHLLCNKRRRDRPITDALRAELRGRRLADLGMTDSAPSVSSRFVGRFSRVPPAPRKDSFRLSPGGHKKNSVRR